MQYTTLLAANLLPCTPAVRASETNAALPPPVDDRNKIMPVIINFSAQTSSLATQVSRLGHIYAHTKRSDTYTCMHTRGATFIHCCFII